MMAVSLCKLLSPIREDGGPALIKGDPVRVFSNQAIAAISDFAVECTHYNAVNVQVFVSGQAASADLTVLSAPQQGGFFLQSPDINSHQANVASNTSFDVVIGQGWARVQISNIAGTFAPGQGYTVIVTPYVSPGQSRVSASIVVDTLSAIQANTGALSVQDVISVATGGVIKSGQTAFDTGVGYWLENNGGTPRFSIGDSAANKVTWDGSALTVKGSLITETGSVINGTFITVDTITADKINVSTLSAIQANIGAANISDVLSIGTSGGIYQGSGTFAVPTTGLKISNSAGIGKLQTFNAGIEQVAIDTDGILKAGAGSVELDASGISIDGPTSTQYSQVGDVKKIKWHNAVGIDISEMATFRQSNAGGNRHTFELHALIQSSLGYRGEVLLYADGINEGESASLFLLSKPAGGEITLSPTVAIGDSPAQSGLIRLPNDQWIAARNAANSADVNLAKVNASNVVEFGPMVETWTPVVVQSSIVSATVTEAKYILLGGFALVIVHLAVTGSGTAGNVISIGGQPTAIRPVVTGNAVHIGSATVNDNGTALYTGSLVAVTAIDWRIAAHNQVNYVGATPSFALANTDNISFIAFYRV